jgi:hypothetical protein
MDRSIEELRQYLALISKAHTIQVCIFIFLFSAKFRLR